MRCLAAVGMALKHAPQVSVASHRLLDDRAATPLSTVRAVWCPRLHSPIASGHTPRSLPAAAVDALCEHNAIDTLLSNFILPLQEDQISTVDPDTNKVSFKAAWDPASYAWPSSLS